MPDRNLESFNMNATCKLHGSPKTASGAVSPLHRLQNLDLMDDIPLTYSKENHTNSPALTTPIIEHNKIMTPRRQPNHHQLHALSNDLSINSTNHKNKPLCGTISGSSGINIVSSGSIGCDGVGSSSGAATTTGGATSQHHYNHHHHQQSHRQSHHSSHHPQHSSSHNNKLDDGCLLRHRWQACPELHKAMDGVNYIADHTKKEEESTKVSKYRQNQKKNI